MALATETTTPVAWRRSSRRWATYTLWHETCGPIRHMTDGEFIEQRQRQWAIPLFLGRGGPDAFWWYRGFVYRCAPSLRWWDIQTIAAVEQAELDGRFVSRWAIESLIPVDSTDASHSGGRPSVTQRFREHGLIESGRRIGSRIGAAVYLDESHIWFERPAFVDPATPLPDGLLLEPGGREELPALKGLPTLVSISEGERRLSAGAELYVVKDLGRVAFACWVFTDAAPAVAAPSGEFELPAGFAVLEDIATAEPYRGRGIAPAAWSAIGRQLSDGGVNHLLMKVETRNGVARHAATKAAFQEAALVRFKRLGRHRDVEIDELRATPVAQLLRERLA